jgi:uncharacterized membrane protein
MTADGTPRSTTQSKPVSTDAHAQARGGELSATSGGVIRCPACGGTNEPDAVFCNNPACHKALGDFRYVLEELRAEARWHHIIADKVTALIAKPHFVTAHFLWFAMWVALNTGIFAFIRTFDDYPFFLLVTILAIETLFITIFVLISNSRQSSHAEKRAELDYEVNVLTYREIIRIHAMFEQMQQRMDRLEEVVRQGFRGREV